MMHRLKAHLEQHAPPFTVNGVVYPDIPNPGWVGVPGGIQGAMRRALLEQGYDSIILTDYEFVIALDPSKVRIVVPSRP